MQIQRKLLTFPVCDAIKWCFGLYASAGKFGTCSRLILHIYALSSVLIRSLNFNVDNIEITILSQSDARRGGCPHSVILYSIKPTKCSFPEWIDRPIDDTLMPTDGPPLTIKQFFLALIKGEAMGFMQPKQMPI